MIEAGERRLRDRRAAPQPDPMLELLNAITMDRDRLKRENAELRARLTGVGTATIRLVHSESKGV